MDSSNLVCALVSEIAEPLRTALLENFSNVRNLTLVNKLRNYGDEMAKYYLVYVDKTPLFFFSLQTSCVFTEQYTPAPKLLRAAERIVDMIQSNQFKYDSKLDILSAAYDGNETELQRIKGLDENEIDSEVRDLSIAVQFLEEQDDPDVSDLSVYDKVIPAIELVEFCKCDSYDSANVWKRLRSQWRDIKQKHTAGEYVFFMYIFPIILRVSQQVGCEILLLYAADSSESKSLVQYYISRLHFTKPGGNIVVNKPMYDVGCKLLMQNLDILKRIYNNIKRDFERDTQPA